MKGVDPQLRSVIERIKQKCFPRPHFSSIYTANNMTNRLRSIAHNSSYQLNAWLFGKQQRFSIEYSRRITFNHFIDYIKLNRAEINKISFTNGNEVTSFVFIPS